MGHHIELELDKVGEKPSSKERSIQEAKKKRLESILGGKPEKKQFADPAVLLGI